MLEQQNFDIMKEFGLENLPDESKQALKEKILDLIESRFNRALLINMSEKEKQELDRILETGKDLSEFIRMTVPNFAELHEQIVADLKQEMHKLDDIMRK
jgi:hypothetical protein